jgi:hypothetical protein
MDVSGMDDPGKRRRKQTPKEKIARSEVLTAMDVRPARDPNL